MASDRHRFKYLEIMLTGTVPFTVPPFITLEVTWFLQTERLQQRCMEQAHMPVFPTVLAHFISPCHILVTLAIFQAFSLLLHFLRLSANRDL